MHKQYDQAQDLWSMGCILFEILQVRFPSEELVRYGEIDPILFRGKECYPLSFQDEPGKDDIDDDDQLKVIMQQIPTLQLVDKCFVNNDESR